MRRNFFARNAAFAAPALFILTTFAKPAEAQTNPDCTTLANAVYAAGSSAVKPVLKALGTKLASAGTLTIVYQSSASCNGVAAFTDATKIKDSAVYWDAMGNEKACTVPLDGITIDVGFSDVFPATCTSNPLPSGTGEFRGPIQVMAFVTGAGSSESSISAEAAYVALGFGGVAPNQVAPWADPKFFFIRPDTSGTKKLISTAIGLPVAKWNKWWSDADMPAHILGKSGDVLAAVAGSTNPSGTLGILAADWFDDYRQPNMGKQIKVLAYQHTGQRCGYLPDSSSTTYDKLNVREGRYAMWGPLHIVAKVGSDNKPSSPLAKTLVSQLTSDGLDAGAKKSIIDIVTKAHVIPQCAMKVTRTQEMGAPAPATTESCGCYFEQVAAGAASSGCAACSADSGCSGATPKCNYGFCEAR